MHKLLLSTLVLLLLIPTAGNSQFGRLKDKVLKRSQDKLERKIEDKVVEKLSEEIARMAFRPIESAMDSALRSSYEEKEGGNVDWEKAGESYGEFLAGLNKAANVPAEYNFDLQVEAEMKDYEKVNHDMTMLYSTTENYMGFETEEDGKKSLIVIDMVNDVMVMYSEEDGKKQAQAIPSMMTMSAAFINQQNVQNSDNYKMTFKKKNKTKKIAGYESQGYEFESEEEKGEAWIAIDFPVDFYNVFGSAFAQFMPKTYADTFEGTKGMIMASEYQNNKDKKLKSSYKVKKVREDKRSLKNSDWGIGTS
jgi:hypothetical protein